MIVACFLRICVGSRSIFAPLIPACLRDVARWAAGRAYVQASDAELWSECPTRWLWRWKEAEMESSPTDYVTALCVSWLEKRSPFCTSRARCFQSSGEGRAGSPATGVTRANVTGACVTGWCRCRSPVCQVKENRSISRTCLAAVVLSS